MRGISRVATRNDARALIKAREDTAICSMKLERPMTTNKLVKTPRLRWLPSFVCLELATAIGAVVGVALIDPDWIWGMGLSNLLVFAVLGLVPCLGSIAST